MSFNAVRQGYRTAGTKQFNADGLFPLWTGYQTKDKSTNKYYFDNSTAYPLTAVATGTTTEQTDNKPVQGDLYGTLFNPDSNFNNKPMVDSNRNYRRITAASPNDGAKMTVSADLSKVRWAVLVAKSPDTSVAAKLKIRSSASNESVCSFTTSSTANTWEVFPFKFREDGSTGVTFTEIPVFTGITEIEITVDTTDSIDAYMLYFVYDYKEIIGAKLDLPFFCLTEAAVEDNLETSNIVCNQLTAAKTGTSREITATLTTNKKTYSNFAYGLGTVMANTQQYVPEPYSNETFNTKTVASNTITVASGLKIAGVFIDGIPCVDVTEYSSTAADIPAYSYAYSSTTMTFNPVHNGKVVTILIDNQKYIDSVDITGLELGYVGYLRLPRRTLSGTWTYLLAGNAQVMLNTETFNDDGDTIPVQFSIYPSASNGKFAIIAEG